MHIKWFAHLSTNGLPPPPPWLQAASTLLTNSRGQSACLGAGRTGSQALARQPSPEQTAVRQRCPMALPGIAQPRARGLGLWPGDAQLRPDPSPPAPAWKEEAREDPPVGLWPGSAGGKGSWAGRPKESLAFPGLAGCPQAGGRLPGSAMFPVHRVPWQLPCMLPAVPEPLHRGGELWQCGQRGTRAVTGTRAEAGRQGEALAAASTVRGFRSQRAARPPEPRAEGERVQAAPHPRQLPGCCPWACMQVPVPAWQGRVPPH